MMYFYRGYQILAEGSSKSQVIFQGEIVGNFDYPDEAKAAIDEWMEAP